MLIPWYWSLHYLNIHTVCWTGFPAAIPPRWNLETQGLSSKYILCIYVQCSPQTQPHILVKKSEITNKNDTPFPPITMFNLHAEKSYLNFLPVLKIRWQSRNPVIKIKRQRYMSPGSVRHQIHSILMLQDSRIGRYCRRRWATGRSRSHLVITRTWIGH